MSYAVLQRTREMGVRLALGTTPGRLRGAALRHMFATISIGSIAGVAAAAAFNRYLTALVKGADEGIVATGAAALALTTLTAAAAIWSATRPITRLDIADVLRAEAAD